MEQDPELTAKLVEKVKEKVKVGGIVTMALASGAPAVAGAAGTEATE